MKKLLLTNGKVTIVDPSDFDAYSKYTAFLSKDGYAYIIVNENGKSRNRLLSRFIMGAKKGEIVDHINHDTLDNRKSNLRICTPLQSARNRRGHSDSKSGLIGVSRYKGKTWRARIFCDKEIYLGYFKDKYEAAKAYNEAAVKYFGEFACLNKINA